jgi:hypothetical protein
MGLRQPAPVNILLPKNFNPPPGAKSLDLASALNVVTGGTVTIMTFTPPQGFTAFLTSFATATDALTPPTTPANFEFNPSISGQRIYEYDGDPMDNFKISVIDGLNRVGLSNIALRQGYYLLAAGQTVTWNATNNSGATILMAVRQVGFMVQGTPTNEELFGG